MNKLTRKPNLPSHLDQSASSSVPLLAWTTLNKLWCPALNHWKSLYWHLWQRWNPGQVWSFLKTAALGWLVSSYVTFQSNVDRSMQAGMNQEQMEVRPVCLSTCASKVFPPPLIETRLTEWHRHQWGFTLRNCGSELTCLHKHSQTYRYFLSSTKHRCRGGVFELLWSRNMT